jgi:tetratricopeptide (TPR) repeat protein
MVSGCRGCEGGSGADLAENEEADKSAKTVPRSASGKAMDNADRANLRSIRRLRMRIPESAEVERPLSESVERARALVENGDRLIAIEAIGVLEARIAEHPSDVDAHYWLGRARVVAEEPRQSAEAFGAAIKLAPEFVAPYRWSAYASHQRRLFSDAVTLLNKAVQLAPEDPDVYIDHIACAVAGQQWDLVLTDVKALCELGETQFCDADEAVQQIIDRRANRKAGQSQGKRAAKKGSKRVGAFRAPGGLGSLRDQARAKAKAKIGKRAEDNGEDGATTE